MKRSLALLLCLMLLLGAAPAAHADESEPVWEQRFYVDVFGDHTDEAYITNTYYFKGTFNNSYATDAKLYAAILADEDDVSIKLLEYGTDLVKNSSSSDRKYYDIKVKMADGSKVDISGSMNPGGDRIFIDTDFAVEALSAGGEVSFYVAERDRSTTNYLFTVSCDNFGRLYQQVFDPETYAAVQAAAAAAQEAARFPAEPMSYAEYCAAELDSPVTVLSCVQASQSWWDNKMTVYCQDSDGAYFLYNMACSEAESRLLVPGTWILVKGYKAEWAGEVEIVDATFEIAEGKPYRARPMDVTTLLGTEELIAQQNRQVIFRGMTVEPYDESGAAFAYKNPENRTDDLYFKVSKDGQTYEFCVEYYLCDESTEVYQAVESLKVGDVVDLVGFLYWYEGPNLHTTSVLPVTS